MAPLIQLMCGWFHIPYTVLTYGKEVWEPLARKYQIALSRSKGIWTISRYTGERLCRTNQIAPGKLQFLPCTIDGDYFTPGSKSRELQVGYGLDPSYKTIMTVARLWSGDIYKGVDVTIRALPIIQATIPNVQYLVVGRGDDQPRLAQLARDLGIESSVHFAGFVPNEELQEHYRLADAYVMPSQEGFGIVYLEAMACGIPVISGDDDGSADPLQDGRLGWQVPHRNPDAVAAASIALLEGSDRRSNGQWLREEIIAAFGHDAFRKRLQELLMLSGKVAEI